MASTKNIAALLLDIEGTTTPISFVYDVLFPFARNNFKAYLENHFEHGDVQQDVERLTLEHTHDAANDASVPVLISSARNEAIESLVNYAHWLMDQDRKSTGLKSLQGKIWEQGYRDLVLQSEVFPDVALALKRWREAGKTVAIFSSGSVLAQKLLFKYSDKGDLSMFVDNYFDTTIGPKMEIKSYQLIAQTLQSLPGLVLFLSDVVAELDAASAAGLQTLLCVRPGNHPQPAGHQHSIIQSFDEI